MANTPKWPRDHASKHAQAARKGWARRRRSGDIAKFGGSSQHTEKSRYLKPRKAQAPKKKSAYKVVSLDQVETKHVAGAKATKGDTFQLITSQKANGNWIISRKYSSGLVVQEPGEWAGNPLSGSPMRKVKPTAAPKHKKGQSLLFGGEYENKAAGNKGLFD